MKQHIFGFVLFNFIVISCGLIFAFLYAPAIPKVEEVKQPAVEYDYRSSCRKRNQPQAKRYTSEIVSSNYYYDENKIVSKIRISVEDVTNLPDKIFIAATYSSSSDISDKTFSNVETIENPFTASREREFTITKRIPNSMRINPKANLYVIVNVTDSNGAYNNAVLNQPKEVLFIHDKVR